MHPAFVALMSVIKTLVSKYSLFIAAPILTLKDISIKCGMHLCIFLCPFAQLKTPHKGANPLIRGSTFLFFLHWGLWTFLLLLLTLQTKGKQSSRLGWFKYRRCKSIAQTEVLHTRLCCVSILASTMRLRSWTVRRSKDENTKQSLFIMLKGICTRLTFTCVISLHDDPWRCADLIWWLFTERYICFVYLLLFLFITSNIHIYIYTFNQSIVSVHPDS